eukprot:UN24341
MYLTDRRSLAAASNDCAASTNDNDDTETIFDHNVLSFSIFFAVSIVWIMRFTHKKVEVVPWSYTRPLILIPLIVPSMGEVFKLFGTLSALQYCVILSIYMFIVVKIDDFICEEEDSELEKAEEDEREQRHEEFQEITQQEDYVNFAFRQYDRAYMDEVRNQQMEAEEHNLKTDSEGESDDDSKIDEQINERLRSSTKIAGSQHKMSSLADLQYELHKHSLKNNPLTETQETVPLDKKEEFKTETHSMPLKGLSSENKEKKIK